VNACPPALRNLVRGALMTGARYSELCRLVVRDINLDARSAAIRESKGGKPRHLALTDDRGTPARFGDGTRRLSRLPRLTIISQEDAGIRRSADHQRAEQGNPTPAPWR
jgi:integrase